MNTDGCAVPYPDKLSCSALFFPAFSAGYKRVSIRSFTLIELIVAIAIIAISTAMASAYFRSESPARSLENASREFEAFCSRVRFRAAENAEEWKVCFDPENSTFIAFKAAEVVQKLPDSSDEDVEERDELEEAQKQYQEKINSRYIDGKSDGSAALMPVLKYKLPEKVTFSTEEQLEDSLAVDEHLELFRFYGDGLGGGGNRLIFSCGELKKTFSISKLTGRLLITEGSPEDMDEMLENDGSNPSDAEEFDV